MSMTALRSLHGFSKKNFRIKKSTRYSASSYRRLSAGFEPLEVRDLLSVSISPSITPSWLAQPASAPHVLTSNINANVQSFALTGPTSGTYASGNSVAIKWTAANVSSNDVISLCLDKDTTFWNGNEQWIEVDKVTASDGNGSYTFNMPNLAAGTYYIGGYMYDKVTYAFTYSHVTSTITVPAKSFTLTSPTSGRYSPGDLVTIAWTATNVSSNDVISLCLDKDTALWNGNEKWIEIDKVSAANGNGSYTFKMPDLAAGTYYVSGYMYNKSNYVFINSDLTQAVNVSAQAFTMTGPTSGTYAPGDSMTFNWTAANVTSNDVVSLCLDKDTTFWNGNEKWVEIDKVSAANGSGSYAFNMPDFDAGTYYVAGYMYDKATYNFTYSHLASTITIPAKSFTLTGPVSGSYASGNSVAITWAAANVSSNDVISLCLDKDNTLWNGNEKWIEIDKVAATNGNGSYTFTMPDLAAGTYYVGGYMYDNSTYVFTNSPQVASPITVPAQTFTLSGPTSGTYTLGDPVTISWTAGGVGSGSLIGLYYDTDTTLNGNEHVIADYISAANGSRSYAWDTTGMTPGTYYIGGYLLTQGNEYTYSHLTSAFNVQRAGVLISQSDGSTNVTEGGATDSYTVVLTSQPTYNVIVNISPDNQVSVDKTSLTFTSNNWNAPQIVTVTAVNDSVAEGNHSGTITHSVSSTDAIYNGISVDNVVAQITDNDGVQSFTLTGPTATTMSTSVGMYTTGQTVQISWTAANVVAGSTISLYYDEDTTPRNGNEHLIDTISAAGGSGSYTWNTTNTTGLHGGIYNIGGYMYDNVGTYTYSYLSLPITILETFDVTYSEPIGGTYWRVYAGGSGSFSSSNVYGAAGLQYAFDNANLGDVIVLDAGATFTGNFVLPNKTGDGWIYIISSAMDQLPGEGVRISPSDASNMPKIISPNSNPAIATALGAHNYRFAGVEFSTASINYNLILMGYDGLNANYSATTVEQLPYNITLDRCYLHSTSDSNWARAGIQANGRYVAVIDSYISNFKDHSGDSQAIAIFFGTGPFKIVNNYLEATTENFMAGGDWISITHDSDPTNFPDPNTGAIPSDIEFRNNYCFKPLYWKADDPSYNGHDWTIKNNFELKCAQRVLVSGNIMENDWVDGQNGTAVLFTVRNQCDQSPWVSIQDVTFENNKIINAPRGMNLLTSDYYVGADESVPAARILIRNNLLKVSWQGFSFMRGPTPATDIVLLNNLVICNSGSTFNVAMWFDSSPGHAVIASGFVAQNNIWFSGDYGVSGTSLAQGITTLNNYAPGYVFTNNLHIMRSVDVAHSNDIANFSARYIDASHLGNLNNYGCNAISNAGFTDFDIGNYLLTVASVYHNAGSDGKDPGPDWDELDHATRRVIKGHHTENKH
jgi:hypothetical protein